MKLSRIVQLEKLLHKAHTVNGSHRTIEVIQLQFVFSRLLSSKVKGDRIYSAIKALRIDKASSNAD